MKTIDVEHTETTGEFAIKIGKKIKVHMVAEGGQRSACGLISTLDSRIADEPVVVREGVKTCGRCTEYWARRK